MDRLDNNRFDFFELLNEISKRKYLFIFFSFIYLVISILTSYMLQKNIDQKKNSAIILKINLIDHDLLPKHYLETNNILYLDENLLIKKTNFMKNFFEDNSYLYFYFYQQTKNISSEVKSFLENFYVDTISKSYIYLKSYDINYLNNIDKKKIEDIIKLININFHEFHFDELIKQNSLIESLEKTLVSKSSFFDKLYDNEDFYLNKNLDEYLYISNRKIINDYKSGGPVDLLYSFDFQNTLHPEFDNYGNNKFKMYVFLIITYFVIVFIMSILFYGHSLNQKINKN